MGESIHRGAQSVCFSGASVFRPSLGPMDLASGQPRCSPRQGYRSTREIQDAYFRLWIVLDGSSGLGTRISQSFLSISSSPTRSGNCLRASTWLQLQRRSARPSYIAGVSLPARRSERCLTQLRQTANT